MGRRRPTAGMAVPLWGREKVGGVAEAEGAGRPASRGLPAWSAGIQAMEPEPQGRVRAPSSDGGDGEAGLGGG